MDERTTFFSGCIDGQDQDFRAHPIFRWGEGGSAIYRCLRSHRRRGCWRNTILFYREIARSGFPGFRVDAVTQAFGFTPSIGSEIRNVQIAASGATLENCNR